MMTRPLLLLTMLTVSLAAGCSTEEGASPTSTAQSRPNLIFIMSDDHAEAAISAYGSKLIQTPNIDRLAKEGVRFENSFVTNSICAPSRAVLLTGKYSHMNGLRDNRDEFDGSQMTLPKLLQQAGYQTAIMGKWHLKTEPTGFDQWKILIDQGEYYSPLFIENGERVEHKGAYVTDLITDFALEFLESRDRDRPFLLLYHHKAPHRNWMPNIKDLGKYADTQRPVPESFYDDYAGREAAASQDMRIADMYLSQDMKLHPQYYDRETGTGGNDDANPERAWQHSYNRMTEEQKAAWDAYYEPISEAFQKAGLEGKDLAEWKYRRYMEDYLGSVHSVDENIGRLLDYLDQNDLAENTLVVYTSDQGFYLGEHGWYDKRFMYEESLSMPLVLRYPREIKAGQVRDELVMNLDFAPTFLDYAGVPIPKDMQGLSFRPLTGGESAVPWRDAIYYHYYEYPHGWHKVKRHYGIRTERYKLIHFYHDIDSWELFDLESDPHELNNLYGKPEVVPVQEELHRRLIELQKQYGDESMHSD